MVSFLNFQIKMIIIFEHNEAELVQIEGKFILFMHIHL